MHSRYYADLILRHDVVSGATLPWEIGMHGISENTLINILF